MNRKLVSLAFAALMGSVSSQALAADKTLTVLMIEGLDKGAMQALADGYSAKHPDVKVEIQALPWSQFFQVSELRLRSKDPAIDIVYTDAPVVASYASNSYIEAFSDETKAEAEKALVPSAVLSGSFEGKLYALPINSSSQVLFYNPAIFTAAGVTPPSGLESGSTTTKDDIARLAGEQRWTWEQVAEAAQKVKKAEGGRTSVWGFAFEQFGELYQLQPLGESKGSPVISADGGTAADYLDGEAWRAAAEFWSKLFNEWQVSPRELGFGEATQLFVNGQLAMFVGGTWNVPAIQSSGVKFGVAPHPQFEGGKAVTPTGSWYLGVSAASQNKDLARDFAAYATLSDEGTQTWFKSLNQLPVTTKLLDTISTSTDFDAFPQSVMRLSAYESLNTAVPRPMTVAFSQLQDAFRTAFVDIANGVDIEEALVGAVDAYDDAARRLNR